MPEKHDAGTSRGGPIVGRGQVLEESRWNVWLFVNREGERGKSNAPRRERRRADSRRTERPPREFSARTRG